MDYKRTIDNRTDDIVEILTIGRKMQLQILLDEIETYNYTTIAQIKGALHTHLELIEEKESE